MCLTSEHGQWPKAIQYFFVELLWDLVPESAASARCCVNKATQSGFCAAVRLVRRANRM